MTCTRSPIQMLLLRNYRNPLSIKMSSFSIHSDCAAKIDLMFVVDSSESMEEEEFEMEKKFLLRMLTYLSVGKNATNVAVIQYSSWFEWIYHFNETQDEDKHGILTAIREME